MRTITLNVCQGVGDIFWVYQKFAPYVDEINFCITHVPKGSAKQQTRAIDFLRLLPKTREVTTRIVSDEEYKLLAQGQYSMSEIMARFNEGESIFDYACNKPLENGVRIEDIDPEYPIEETVDIRCDPCPLVFEAGKYVTLYVSGSTIDECARTTHRLWNLHLWFDFIRLFYARFGLSAPIKIIGASYDECIATNLQGALNRAGHETTLTIDACAANVTYILKNSLCYIGYQSGLNILADNLDVKQIMLYFPTLKNMLYAWCKKKNFQDKTYNAYIFDSTPYQVVMDLEIKVGKPSDVSLRKIFASPQIRKQGLPIHVARKTKQQLIADRRIQIEQQKRHRH
jgi:hypothetical protein